MHAAGKRYIVYSKAGAQFLIWCLADVHWMSKACAEDKFRADIERIANDPYSFWLSGGDMVDFLGYRDKRFDPDSVAEWVKIHELGDLGQAGMKQIADMLKPIKHKCLGLLLGNHEKQYQLRTEHESLHGWLCTELGAPNLGYCALFDLIFVRRAKHKGEPELRLKSPATADAHKVRFRVFTHHGAGYAQTPGGKLNRLVQFMQSFEADIYFVAHVHDHMARKEPLLGADAACTTLREKQRLGVVSGSYLKSYEQNTTTYAEQRGYRPASLGAGVVKIVPEKRYLSAVI